MEIYSQIFPGGNGGKFAEHVFGTFDTDRYKTDFNKYQRPGALMYQVDRVGHVFHVDHVFHTVHHEVNVVHVVHAVHHKVHVVNVIHVVNVVLLKV